jgi:hypothetical protein
LVDWELTPDSVTAMPEALDVDAMIARFRERAAAVRRRGLPPVEGAERKLILQQMQLDFQDFAMLADATGSLEEGILTLRVDLRPPAANDEPAAPKSGAEGAGKGEAESELPA